MSQHDLSIANATFPNTRSDINSALQALGSLQSGTSAPSTTYADMLWLDTTNNVLYLRNNDDDAWIEVFDVDQTNDLVELVSKLKAPNGTVSAPSITFDSDTDTGLYRSAANEMSVATNGNQVLIVDADGHLTCISASPEFLIKDNDSTGASVTGEIKFLESDDTVAASVTYESETLKLEIAGSSVAEFTSTGNDLMPTGAVIQFAGTTPSGWLDCDGSAVSRTTYATLFAVTGTTYGAGDGSTTFNLPTISDDGSVGHIIKT